MTNIQLLTIYLYFYIPFSVFMSYMGFYKKHHTNISLVTYALILMIIVILLLRDINAPMDVSTYIGIYSNIQEFNDIFHTYASSYFFAFLMYVSFILGLSPSSFFTILPIINIILLYYGLTLIFYKKSDRLLALSLFSLTSTFILLSTNVVRQGLALSLLIIVIGLFLKERWFIGSLVFVLAIFSHLSMIPIAMLLYITQYSFNNKFVTKNLLYFAPIFWISGIYLFKKLNEFGGLFSKIGSFASVEYNNNILLVKYMLLTIFWMFLHYYGVRLRNFTSSAYRYLYVFYSYLLFFILFTSSVPLISSRYIYYLSGLMPLLLVFIFNSQKNLLNINKRYLFFVILSILYGFSTYSYPSIQLQLGLIPR